MALSSPWLRLSDQFYPDRPSRIFDQHFGHGLSEDDMLAPYVALWKRPTSSGYIRPWESSAAETDAGSTVHVDKDKFQANLDVQQFAPDEISVKVTGENEITVEGKHEEKEDDHGYVSRRFVRKYILPKGCDVDKAESKLSSDGVLMITAPRICKKQLVDKKIPVTKTGKPFKQAVEDKKEEKTDRKLKKK